MKEIENHVVKECGWAGPLFWVTTSDDYAIHLYDAPISLNRSSVEIGQDIRSHIEEQTIEKIEIDSKSFTVVFNGGSKLSIESKPYETARIFKQSSEDSHHVYENGTFEA